MREERRRADAALVEASRSGDESAFGQLYDRWFDSVHDLANRIVHDQAAAADIAQDTFIKAWQGLDGLRDPASFGGWLLRIARTTALNHVRASGRRPVVDPSRPGVAEATEQLRTVDDPAAVAENAEICELLLGAADALGERDADVLDLHLRHGLEPAEIGEVVGVNRNAANQLVHRLRGRLKRAVEARVLWNDGHPRCENLGGDLAHRGITEFDQATARFIDAHAENCDECTERRRTRLAPAALFGAVPVLVASIYRQDVAAALEAEGLPMAGSEFSPSGVSAGVGAVSGGVNGEDAPLSTGENAMPEPTNLEGDPDRPFALTRFRIPIIVGILAAVIATILVIVATDGDGEGGGDEAGDDGGTGGSSQDGSDGDGSGDDGGGGGSDGGTGGSSQDGSDGGGDSGEDGGSGGGGAGGSGGAGGFGGSGLCGPEEFLGGLPRFVVDIADNNVLPPRLRRVLETIGPFLGPLSPVAEVPVALADGGAQAYAPLADAIRDQCPGITGDPHVTTIDGRRYDFQAVGEFVALRSSDGDIEVQVRTAPMGTGGKVSGVGAVALRVDGRLLVIDHEADDIVTLDGEPLEAPGAIRTDNDAYILRDEREVGVWWPDEATTVSVTRADKLAMNVHFSLGADYVGTVAGLMGNADGEADHDLADRDGKGLSDSFEDIHGPFRNAWRVSDDESLFPGPSTFRADYPSEQVSLSGDEIRAARETCVGAGIVVGDILEDCVVDVASTGDAELADAHRERQRDRLVFVDTDCTVDLDGPVVTGGHGAARTWSTGGVDFGADQAWTFETVEGDAPRVGTVTPVDTKRALVTDTSNGVSLIDPSGEVQWTMEADPLRSVEPVVAGETAFVATDDSVVAFGLDGTPCWRLVTHRNETVAALSYAGEVLVVRTHSSRLSVLMGVDPVTGEVLWSTVPEVEIATVSTDTAPAIADGRVVVEGERGVVLAYDVATGDQAWRYEPEASDTTSAVAIVDDTVYVTGRQHGLTALDLDDGSLRWAAEAPGGGVTERLAVGSGIAVMADESIVTAVDSGTGETLWILGDDEAVQAEQPVIAGDVVLFNAAPRQLVAVAVADGSEVARIDEAYDTNATNSREAFLAAPVVWGDQVLVVVNNGDLVAYG